MPVTNANMQENSTMSMMSLIIIRPQDLRPEIPLDAIPAWWRHSGEDCRICGQPRPLLSSCVLEDTVRKSFDAFGSDAN